MYGKKKKNACVAAKPVEVALTFSLLQDEKFWETAMLFASSGKVDMARTINKSSK